MSESNVCEQCGGILNYFVNVELIYATDTSMSSPFARAVLGVPAPSFNICSGTCKKPEKHEGDLGDSACVRHDTPTDLLILDDSYGGGPIALKPKQALSLLAWLKQEEGVLQQLAEEQEE